MQQPVCIYINWAAYDELSDNVELTEQLALAQLDELLRLRALGVRLEYYLMDAFWYARDGGYRTWRQPHWPHGPDRWLDRCLDAGVRPGLWVTANSLNLMDPFPAWHDSFDPETNAYCCFSGGYLEHFMETLRQYVQRGVRLFKFDFADFSAAPVRLKEVMLPSEIRQANIQAFQTALKQLRRDHPDVLLLGYNGLEETYAQGSTSLPLRRSIDTRWLDVFDAVYCGDPRPADVPCARFWRSKDIYSDHMVRYYEANGYPLHRIDNSGFMIGLTGTCYKRGTAAWQGMLLLSMARGGWANTLYGNLELLDGDKANWMARAQRLMLPLQQCNAWRTFGGVPGQAQPYGYRADTEAGSLVLTVNPGQSMAAVPLDVSSEARVLFCDAGYAPKVQDGMIRLGPEQLALVGTGCYADSRHELGVQQDVSVPCSIQRLAGKTTDRMAQAAAQLTLRPSKGAGLRVVMQQTRNGMPVRTSGGSPPDGQTLGRLLTITVRQNGQELPVQREYDKAIWSGLSWAAAEVGSNDLNDGDVVIHCATSEPDVQLDVEVYAVRCDG